jgi:hypothetical protein
MGKHNLQKTIVQIIIQSRRNGLSSISNKQIAKQIGLIFPEMKDVDRKVSYALYLLKRKEPRWNEPKIIRTKEGWTIDTSTFNIWKIKEKVN